MRGRAVRAVGLFGFLLVAATAAGQQKPEAIQKLLPADAVIIETADLTPVAGKSRALVLWMKHPGKFNRPPGGEFCGDAAYGDHWFGPTRISLVDPTGSKLLGTFVVKGNGSSGDPADSFRLPFFVPECYYHVPHPNSEHEGKPEILRLRDLTGEGVAAEFVLFMHAACGIAYTSVFGYSRQADKVVQYPVQVIEAGRRPEIETWVEVVFAVRPIRPGRWSFSWEPGHGSEDVIHEDVSFDRAKQMFVERRKLTSSDHPSWGARVPH